MAPGGGATRCPQRLAHYSSGMPRLDEIPFVKGHGTGNDFVLVPDLEGRLDLTPDDVRFLCDRRFGLGGDGLIRIVRTAYAHDLDDVLRSAEFFMDYRNADGSVAEMCGNGARVFVRYLDATGLMTDPDVTFATRGGLCTGTVNADLTVSVTMGRATGAGPVEVRIGETQWPAVAVHVPNPHAVAFVDDLAVAGDLRTPPETLPVGAFPDGVNVEFVVERGPAHIAMRVHERGIGETLSCGTGACAAAWAAAQRHGVQGAFDITVDVPGGTVTVTSNADGELTLRGPADLVARGTALLTR